MKNINITSLSLNNIDYRKDKHYAIGEYNYETGEYELKTICSDPMNLDKEVLTILSSAEFRGLIGVNKIPKDKIENIKEWKKLAKPDIYSPLISGIIKVTEINNQGLSNVLNSMNIMNDETDLALNCGNGIFKHRFINKGLSNHIYLEMKSRLFGNPIGSRVYRTENGFEEVSFWNVKDNTSNITEDLARLESEAGKPREKTPMMAPVNIIKRLDERGESWISTEVWKEIIFDLIFNNTESMKLEDYVVYYKKQKDIGEAAKDVFNESITKIRDTFGDSGNKREPEKKATTKLKDLFDVGKVKINKSIKSVNKEEIPRMKTIRYMPCTIKCSEQIDVLSNEDNKNAGIKDSVELFKVISSYGKDLLNLSEIYPFIRKLYEYEDEIVQIVEEAKICVNVKADVDHLDLIEKQLLKNINGIYIYVQEEMNKEAQRIEREQREKKRLNKERKQSSIGKAFKDLISTERNELDGNEVISEEYEEDDEVSDFDVIGGKDDNVGADESTMQIEKIEDNGINIFVDDTDRENK